MITADLVDDRSGAPMTEAAPRTQRIIVEPAATGWSVLVAGADNPMVFASGRVAEKAGRDLAVRLAEAGMEVQLELRLRGGAVAARFICFPPLETEDIPLMIETPRVRPLSDSRTIA